MSKRVRVLLVEDSEDDARMAVRLLKRGGFEVQFERVDTAYGLEEALSRQSWDAVIADYRMPQFTGLDALKIVRESGSDIPFVLVSGTVGEEIAVGAMKAGANDFIIKMNLSRLAPVLDRELREAANRAEHRHARHKLRESEAGLHRAQVMAALAHVVTGPEGRFESWSETLPQLAGIEADPMVGSTQEWLGLVHPDDRDSFRAKMLEAGATGRRTDVEYRLRRADGRWIDIRQFIEPFPGEADSKDEKRWFSTLQDITEQKSAEDRLRESELRFRQLAENIHEVFFLIDPANTQMLYVSPAYEAIWGRSVASLYENPLSWTDPIHPDDRERVFAALKSTEHSGRLDYEYRIVRPDGAVRWIHARGFPILDKAGKLYRVAGIAEEITERKRSEEKIRRLNRVYAVLSQINSLIVRVRVREELFHEACRICVEQGLFRMAWIGMLKGAPAQVESAAWAGDVRGFFDSASFAVPDGKGKRRGLAWQAILEKKAMIANDVQTEVRTIMKNECMERGINSLAMLPLVMAGAGAGVLALYASEAGFFDGEEMKLLLELAGDISFALEHIANSEKLDYLAYYDALTGLANRKLFLERLEQKLIAARGAERKLAVSIVDIARFKTINDAFGRQMGDELLRQIAERMTSSSQDPTRIARIAADHFAIVSADLETEEDVGRLTEQRLETCFTAPFRLEGQDLRVSARVGIAMYPADGTDPEALFANAEAALKKAKATDERYLFFTPAMTDRIHETLSLENKLREALEKDQFVLHYQPKVHLETRQIIGMEALIRWQSPELGVVPPMKFIPLLEASGLILQVGSWALKRAATDHRAWVEAGLKPPKIAVNVSPIQLRQRDFVQIVEQAIMDGMTPSGIDLEITESLIMDDVQGNIEKLKAVRALGIDIAVDDFGTGYSSLGYLARLPVQTLKIDRSFIITMLKDPDTMTLVSTIISLAHSLRLKVVAEGVEDEEQAKMLRLLRCDEMQGYLFSKPIPFAQMTALLKQRQV
jgi:diguanylate cyclase (GGDEF)-like protein/PAS domain S-box-containing protein